MHIALLSSAPTESQKYNLFVYTAYLNITFIFLQIYLFVRTNLGK